MGQVGHADSKMTMDVYAQLQQRVKREHGRAFDRLVDRAREQLYGTDSEALESSTGNHRATDLGHEGRNRGRRAPHDERSDREEPDTFQGDPGGWRDRDSSRGRTIPTGRTGAQDPPSVWVVHHPWRRIVATPTMR
jgi:hypothetical protein